MSVTQAPLPGVDAALVGLVVLFAAVTLSCSEFC
jgi:hypothetical protein